MITYFQIQNFFVTLKYWYYTVTRPRKWCNRA